MKAIPGEQLDPRARTVWRIGGVLAVGAVALALTPVAVALVWFDVVAWWWVVGVAVPVIAAALVAVYWIADLNWRQWRYEVGSEEVDLQYGVLTVTRTLIPMARIQHVDTRRSPLQRRFGLASVVLYTAAGANEIPALADPIAASVRDRIADLANTRDDI
jgi:membrane protein YdbS with pleckstrin-like domain